MEKDNLTTLNTNFEYKYEKVNNHYKININKFSPEVENLHKSFIERKT